MSLHYYCRLQKGSGAENVYDVIREHKGSKRNAGTVHLQTIQIEVRMCMTSYESTRAASEMPVQYTSMLFR